MSNAHVTPYQDALSHIIEDGIAAVHRDYPGDERKHHRYRCRNCQHE